MHCEVSVSCREVVSVSPMYVLDRSLKVLLSLRLTIAW